MRGKMLGILWKKKDIKMCVYIQTQYNHKYEKMFIYICYT